MPRPHSRYLNTDSDQKGFSAIAPNFWRTAEKLRTEAVEATAQQNWKVHWTVPSAICLYHAALDCFINEEIAIALAHAGAASDDPLTHEGRSIQDMTLNQKKLESFFSIFQLNGKGALEVRDRTLKLIRLRNILYHHAPEMRDVRDYPKQAIDALKDAGIDPVNTSWATQCMDVRLAEWASKAVRALIDDWCRAAGIPSRMKDPGFAGSVEPATRGSPRWLAWLPKFTAPRLSS
jgi:hypothetical protein